MGQSGLGVMMHYLGGGSEHDASEYYGKTITYAKLDKNNDIDVFRLKFSDGVKIEILDDGQS